MQTFQYTRVSDPAQAINAASSGPIPQGTGISFLAGGTTLVDLMKLNVEHPERVIDINRLPFSEIESLPAGGIKIGALVRNSDLAHHPIIQRDYSVLSQALLSGASPQLRNKATTAGNLLQRTRCIYFRDTATACNKREPGTGCSAIEGTNRMMAILGTSDHCIASNPSDMNVALTALEATIHIQNARGTRSVQINNFFLLPETTPNLETVLEPGDLVTHVSLPALPPGNRSIYLKLRDRASYEFALASAAVIAAVKDGRLKHVRIAMGGVGTKPWRSLEAEQILGGASPEESNFRKAAEAALQGARPQSENGFKVELAKRCLIHALKLATQA